MGPRPATSTSPGHLLGIRIPRSHPRPRESENLREGPAIFLTSLPGDSEAGCLRTTFLRMPCLAFCILCVLEYLGRSGLKADLLENGNAGPPVQAFCYKTWLSFHSLHSIFTHRTCKGILGIYFLHCVPSRLLDLACTGFKCMHVCCFEDVLKLHV